MRQIIPQVPARGGELSEYDKQELRREFYRARYVWATNEDWKVADRISRIAGFLIAVLVAIKSEWAPGERMTAIVSVLLPIGAGFSVFLIRWLTSPFYVWKKERAALVAAGEESHAAFLAKESEIADLKKIIADFTDDGAHFRLFLFNVSRKSDATLLSLGFINEGKRTASDITTDTFVIWSDVVIRHHSPNAVDIHPTEKIGADIRISDSAVAGRPKVDLIFRVELTYDDKKTKMRRPPEVFYYKSARGADGELQSTPMSLSIPERQLLEQTAANPPTPTSRA